MILDQAPGAVTGDFSWGGQQAAHPGKVNRPAEYRLAAEKVFPNPSCIRIANPLWDAFGVDGAMAPNQTWLPPCKDETGDG